MNYTICKNIQEDIDKAISTSAVGVYIYQPNHVTVFTNLTTSYDKEYCDKCSIEVINSHNSGGTIVSFPGDLDIATIEKLKHFNKPELCLYEKLYDYLVKREVPGLIRSNNDSLAEGKFKVMSYAARSIFSHFYNVIHINFHSDASVINHICKKEMIKVPKGLSSYGITAEEIYSFIKSL